VGKSLAERFWEKVNVRRYGCWEWNAAVRGADGYGQFSLDGKPVQAHRLAWELSFGQIPEGKQIHHRCHNRKCVRPSHLTSITAEEHRRLHIEERAARA
jgi:hypothetical protein